MESVATSSYKTQLSSVPSVPPVGHAYNYLSVQKECRERRKNCRTYSIVAVVLLALFLAAAVGCIIAFLILKVDGKESATMDAASGTATNDVTTTIAAKL